MKTHVTVIPSDGIISVDGEVLFLDGITSETFHALQWHDGAGHVEPGNGLPNEELSTDDYAGRVAPFVALWEEEKARLEEEANRPPTDEELAAQAVAEARAQSRSILMARMQADMVQTGAFTAAEFTTFAKAGLFTDWAAGQTYAKGYRLAHKGIVYEVIQEVTAIENQPPDAAGLLAQSLDVDIRAEYTPVKLERPFYGVYDGQAALPMKPDELWVLESDSLYACTTYNIENRKTAQVYDMEKLSSRDLYDVFLSGPVSVLTVENPAANTEKELIVFRDSFGSSMVPLLIPGYAKVTLADIRYLPSSQMGKYLTFTDQDVLFLYSAPVLNNSETLK